jgi:hypothetical protein
VAAVMVCPRHAFFTDKKFWPKKTVTELKPMLAKYL